MIDSNLYVGAALFGSGIVFKVVLDLLIPSAKNWLSRLAGHAQLRLNDKKYLQSQAHGTQPKLQQKTAGGTP